MNPPRRVGQNCPFQGPIPWKNRLPHWSFAGKNLLNPRPIANEPPERREKNWAGPRPWGCPPLPPPFTNIGRKPRARGPILTVPIPPHEKRPPLAPESFTVFIFCPRSGTWSSRNGARPIRTGQPRKGFFHNLWPSLSPVYNGPVGEKFKRSSGQPITQKGICPPPSGINRKCPLFAEGPPGKRSGNFRSEGVKDSSNGQGIPNEPPLRAGN